MFVKADLHIHTKWSDGALTIPEIIDFYASHSFQVIAVTDHGRNHAGVSVNWPEYYLDMLNNIPYAASKGMLLIPGLEVSQHNAHIGILGVKEYIPRELLIEEIIQAGRNQRALVVANHVGPIKGKDPKHMAYLDLWNRMDELIPQFDVVEIANGNQFFPEVAHYGKPYIANTDFHIRENMVSWKNLLDVDELTVEGVFQAIMEHKNYIWRFK